ncbi:MAG: hypothetical protein ROD09_18895 [Candidatus Sedimenticola sp. (ex Thyasira tokunagai)]
MSYDTPRITQGSDWRIKVLWVLLLSALLLSLLSYYGGGNSVHQQVAGSSDQASRVKALEQKQSVLEAERQALRKQVALLERSGQIDREAALQLGVELKSEQEERIKLAHELSLLKRIVSSSVTTEGLYVQGFKLDKKAGKNRYHYRFTVSQALKDAGTATGWIHIEVEGERGEVVSTLSLQELSDGGSEKLKMRFRHFQDIDGEISLPEGFLPRSMIVNIKPTNKKLPPLEKRFDWLVAG